MWLFVNNQPCFGYIHITTLNNKNTFGAPYLRAVNYIAVSTRPSHEISGIVFQHLRRA